MNVIRVNDKTVDAVLATIYGKTVGFDIETSSLNKNEALLSVMQVYDPKSETVYLFPFRVVDAKLSEESQKKVLATYTTLKLVGHNLFYDVFIINRQYGLVPAGIEDDTYILACMLQAPSKALKDLALQVKPDLVGKLQKFQDTFFMAYPAGESARREEVYYSFENAAQVRYMALDPALPFLVKKGIYRESIAKAYEIEKGVIIPLAVASASGLPVDRALYESAVKEMTEKRDSLQNVVNELVGYPIKVNSTAQLQRALFEERGLPLTPIKTGSGAPSTSEEALKYLEGDELVDKVLELKHYISVCSSSAKALDTLDENNVAHPEFLQVGQDGTSRIYTTKPSINQWTWEMRGCITPRPGYKFVHADWKSAELYIAAYLAKEERILSVYDQGGDVHSYLSSLLLGVDKPDKAQREVSKVLTFATMYGSEGAAVSRKLRCSEDEAKDLVSRYLTILSNIKALRDRIQAEALRTFHTKTMFGRQRYLSNLSNPGMVDKGKRQAFNTFVQGSCADFQKVAITKFFEKYASDDVRFKFTVFDSFLLEVPGDYTNEQIEEILDYMSDFSDTFEGFRLRYSYGVGYTWRDAYELS